MQLRDRLGYVARPIAPAGPPVRSALPPGISRGLNSYGEVLYRDQFFPLDHLHGRLALESALECDDDLLERLGPDLTRDHVREAAYLDIETTGMSGGTGTYAFLIGVGTFEGLWFRVRQFFMANPGSERAMLAGLSETIERCRSVVTFNGKSFDIPQLATRFALARLPDPHAGLPHIDLLHPARRLFTGALESCRLAEVEKHLLRFRRYGDISGVLIPALYFAYVRRNNTRGLDPIFEHNSHDVLSLVAFMAYLNEAAGAEASGDSRHHYRLGKWDEKRGRTDPAMQNHRIAWEGDSASDEGGQAILRLTRGLMRAGDWRQCVELWQEELARTQRTSRLVRAHIELAKLYEHKLRDTSEALRLCHEGMALIERSPSPRSFEPSAADLTKRAQRLSTRRRTSSGNKTT